MRTSSALSRFVSSAAGVGAVAALLTFAPTAMASGAPQGTIVGTGPLTMVYDGACLFAYGTADLAPIAQYECLGSADQSFEVMSAGDGIGFVIMSTNSSMCLSITGNSLAVGALLEQDACTGATNQRFMPVRNSDGSYQLVAENSGKCIEVPNSSTSVVQLDQLSCTGGTNQRFKLTLPAGDILLSGQLVVAATGAVDSGNETAPATNPGTNVPVGWNLARN